MQLIWFGWILAQNFENSSANSSKCWHNLGAIESQMVGCIFWIDLDGLAVVLDGLGCYLKQVALDKEIAFLQLEIMTPEASAVHRSHFAISISPPVEKLEQLEHVCISIIL